MRKKMKNLNGDLKEVLRIQIQKKKTNIDQVKDQEIIGNKEENLLLQTSEKGEQGSENNQIETLDFIPSTFLHIPVEWEVRYDTDQGTDDLSVEVYVGKEKISLY